MKTVRGKNGFCGPAVVSAITGVTTDQASAVIREVSGMSMVRGTFFCDLDRAFDWLGYRVSTEKTMERPVTLIRASEIIGKRTAILDLPNHWGAISRGTFADSRYRSPVRVEDVRHRYRVRRFWLVKKVGRARPIPGPKARFEYHVRWVIEGEVEYLDYGDTVSEAIEVARELYDDTPKSAVVIEKWDKRSEYYAGECYAFGDVSSVRLYGYQGEVSEELWEKWD
jgi:hypothetical protein